MQKIILLFLTLSLSLFGSIVKEVSYESGISLYGQIGLIHLKLEENHSDNTYRINIKATSTGAVKYLSGNRIDTFMSEGIIKDGTYFPLKFTRNTTKNNFERQRTYLFDYKHRTVQKTELTLRNEITTSFDIFAVKLREQEELVREKKEETIEFQTNDFLSLYLNLIKGNLQYGKVPYVDMKEKDSLLFVKQNLFEVHKNNDEEKYLVVMEPDTNSRFFKTITSVDIAFFGDAYIKKIAETTKILEN